MREITIAWKRLLLRHSWILKQAAPLAIGVLFSAASQAVLIGSGRQLEGEGAEGVINGVYVGDARFANYNFTILDEFGNHSRDADIDVTIDPLQDLGPLPAFPSTTSTFRQSLTIKNVASEIRRVSFINGVNVNMGTRDTCPYVRYPYCDAGYFDADSQVLYTTHEPWDPPYENEFLFATAVSVDKWDAKLGYGIEDIDGINLYFEDLKHSLFGKTGDITTMLGLDGILNPYQEVTVHFDYLWANGLDSIPSEFRSNVPEPAPLLLLVLGLASGLLVSGKQLQKTTTAC